MNHEVENNSMTFKAIKSFIRQQCVLNVQMSCHFIVLLVKHFRDKHPYLRSLFILPGVMVCNIHKSNGFLIIGSMNNMERSYDFHDLVNIVDTWNCLSYVVSYTKNGLEFGRVHNKVENVWFALHPLAKREAPTNLSDNSMVAMDYDIISTLKGYFKEAQAMPWVLKIATSNKAFHCNIKFGLCPL